MEYRAARIEADGAVGSAGAFTDRGGMGGEAAPGVAAEDLVPRRRIGQVTTAHTHSPNSLGKKSHFLFILNK